MKGKENESQPGLVNGSLRFPLPFPFGSGNGEEIGNRVCKLWLPIFYIFSREKEAASGLSLPFVNC